MKAFISILAVLLIAGCSSPGITQSDNQQTTGEMEGRIAGIISGQFYTFYAQTALPMRGRSRPLTSEYDLRVTPDSITAWLPYFGRAYTAPLDLTGGGIQFVSTDFEYSIIDRKKGGWDILIKPKDVRGTEQLRLTVSTSGYGSLQVTSTNRQPISFNGYVDESKSKQ